jgi:RNA-binding protein YhbY
MATIEIPKNVLEPIINAHITAALTEVFGDGHGLLDKIVKKVLTAHVDSRGELSSPSTYTKPTLEHMAHQAVKQAALEAMKEALDLHREAVKAAIVRELSSSKSKMLKTIAASMVDSLHNTIKGGYRVEVVLKEIDR